MTIFTTQGKSSGKRSIGAHRASRRSSLARSIRRSHLARNSIFVMANTAATGLLGFAYWGIAAHSYTTHAIGVATALLGAMNLMCLIGTLGIGQTLLQQLLAQRMASGPGL